MRTHVILLVAVAVGLILSACVPMAPPVSPLPEIRESPLMGQWRVETLTMDGETTDLRPYSPTFVTFTPSGTVNIREYCNSGSQSIYYQESNHYLLGNGMSTAARCTDVHNLDWSIAPCSDYAPPGISDEECQDAGSDFITLPSTALDKTNQYSLSGDHLLLLGDDAWVELVRDETEMPWFLIGHWVVETITSDGEVVEYRAPGPFFLTFQPDGYAFAYSKCPLGSFTYRFGHDWSYELEGPFPTRGPCDLGISVFATPSKCIALVGMEGSYAECLRVFERMARDLLDALAETDHVDSPGNGHTFLRGDGVEIDLNSTYDYGAYMGYGTYTSQYDSR